MYQFFSNIFKAKKAIKTLGHVLQDKGRIFINTVALNMLIIIHSDIVLNNAR